MRRESQLRKRAGAAQRVATVRLGEHVAFTEQGVADAPAMPGVYLLYCQHRLIYIGLAPPGSTIRRCLAEHLRGERGACTAAATEFDYESSVCATRLYRHYMAIYLEATGGLIPECNDRQETYVWLSCMG